MQDESRVTELLAPVTEAYEVVSRRGDVVLIETTRRDGQPALPVGRPDAHRDLSCLRYRTAGVRSREACRHGAAASWSFAATAAHALRTIFERIGRCAVLELGCGSSAFHQALAANHYPPDEDAQVRYYGIDVRGDRLEAAAAALAEAGDLPAALIRHDPERPLPLADGAVDVAVDLGVVGIHQGAKAAQAQLREVARVLSGDGVALVVVPRARVVTADRASGWQVEDLSAFFSEAGLAPLQAFGAEVDPTELRDVLAPRDRATFRALSAFHPPELIDALLGPLYPEVARKVLVVCGKAAGEVPPVPALEPRGRKRRGAKRDGLLAVGDLFEERYYVERFVRAGSQGEVYRARDNVLDEPVALKLLTAYEAGRCLERLRAEAAVAGRLAGPELPRWLGAGRGTTTAVWYRVYGWVEGESLSQRLRAAGAVGLPLAARIARDLLRVLDRMERARLGPERAAAHGDVRVRNVILRPDGGACLIDFGLARPVERPKEPEPGRYPTDAIAPARDRFDAGAVIFEAAVGRPPWPGPADRGDKQAPDFPYGEGEATWPWPADDVPEPLRALVTGLLTTDPERRFSSAAAARAQAEQVWADLAGGADAAS